MSDPRHVWACTAPLLSRRVPNNEAELLELIGDVLALAEDDPVTWAVD